jgi:hypothetical protein
VLLAYTETWWGEEWAVRSNDANCRQFLKTEKGNLEKGQVPWKNVCFSFILKQRLEYFKC